MSYAALRVGGRPTFPVAVVVVGFIAVDLERSIGASGADGFRDIDRSSIRIVIHIVP
jgi:hypothetical protein